MWWLILARAALAWEVLGPGAAPTGDHVAAAQLFVETPTPWPATAVVSTDPEQLGAMAASAATSLRALRAAGDPRAAAAAPGEAGISVDAVLATLDLVARVAAEDHGKPAQRLADPAWLARTFRVVQWRPDVAAAALRGVRLEPDTLRLTKYVVYTVAGSPARTDTHDTALYAAPADDAVRARLTRMDVYSGAFGPGGSASGAAKPLVWVTRQGSNEALMQGTIRVTQADAPGRLYQVHRSNGVAYDPSIRDPDRQARYWYFRAVSGVTGATGIPLQPHAAVAGDVYNVGVGKLIALQWPTPTGPGLRLVVLADTGGAFQPNLFQLDYYAGVFPSVAAFQTWARTAPTRVPAAILVRR